MAGVRRTRILAKHLPACTKNRWCSALTSAIMSRGSIHDLAALVPAETRVVKVGALPENRLCRAVGIGDLGMQRIWSAT